MKKTVTAPVWCNSDYELANIYASETGKLPSGASISSANMQDCGWIQIGTAVIEMTLIPPQDTVAAQIQSLEAQIKSAQAEAEKTITILRSRINDLLAIEVGK